ncbi:hypothetical protein MNBD_NITROSPIRAE02-1422, partial [hydrothermal vent metagenome]
MEKEKKSQRWAFVVVGFFVVVSLFAYFESE